MTHLFVYGTLMRGRANHRVLVDLKARFVSAARTERGRTLVDLGPYPALLPLDPARDRGAPDVEGELYELPERDVRDALDALDALDAFEEVPDLYRRERIAIVAAGALIDAWVYVLAQKPPKGRSS